MDLRIEVTDLRRQLEAGQRKSAHLSRENRRLREERDQARRRPAAAAAGSAAQAATQRGTDLRQVRAGQPLAVFPREDLTCRWYRLTSADLAHLRLASRTHLTDRELSNL